jgi:hypothetical protein
MSSRSHRTEVVSRDQERAERAARVAAMLERWAKQDLPSEPSWEVDDIERVRLAGVEAEADDRSPR